VCCMRADRGKDRHDKVNRDIFTTFSCERAKNVNLHGPNTCISFLFKKSLDFMEMRCTKAFQRRFYIKYNLGFYFTKSKNVLVRFELL
jgi:hypothetical protein